MSTKTIETVVSGTGTASKYTTLTPVELRAALKARGIATSRRTSAGHGYHAPALCIALLEGTDNGQTVADIFAAWDTAHGITAAAPTPKAARVAKTPKAAPAAPAPAPVAPAESPEGEGTAPDSPEGTKSEEPAKEPAKTEAPRTVRKPRKAPPKATEDETAIATEWENFLGEFGIIPQARLYNQIFGAKNAKECADYLLCYAKITGNPDSENLGEKLKSAEAKGLIERSIAMGLECGAINRRLEIYFGPAGSGKTTKALEENPGAEKIPCAPEMTVEDLLKGFDFEEGKATFHSLPMREAMEEGRTVVLDEINLLPQTTLRALQSYTDGSGHAFAAGKHIEIKDGFKIVGTMNLDIDGVPCPLPTPLVDRAGILREIRMNAGQALAIARRG